MAINRNRYTDDTMPKDVWQTLRWNSHVWGGSRLPAAREILGRSIVAALSLYPLAEVRRATLLCYATIHRLERDYGAEG